MVSELICLLRRCFSVALSFAVGLKAAELRIVDSGTSEYEICRPTDATADVLNAANELQRIIRIATGVTLPVGTGDGGRQRIELVEDPKLGADEFEIRRNGMNVSIAGHTVKMRKGSETWAIPSQGVVYGVNEFLERFLGVRWLLPGVVGEDVVPIRRLRIDIPSVIRGKPAFKVRHLEIPQLDPEGVTPLHSQHVRAWLVHQRLSIPDGSAVLNDGHAWSLFIGEEDVRRRPEWRARDGDADKFCTTAPGLVEEFSKRVQTWLDANPGRKTAPISPADGGGFCRCSRCEPRLIPDRHGKPSHAPLMLEFYREVALRVKATHPDRRLGALVYYNYQYPPATAPAMPDNIYLCWAPLNYYGYGLFKEPYRAEFENIMGQWSAIAHRLVYYNYSTWMRSFHGAPLPLGVEMLKLELPVAARHGAWGVRMVGHPAWGVGAAGNYLLARQMWDPSINLSAVLNEWLRRAYGPGGVEMRRLYDRLDSRMKAYKQAEPLPYRGEQYEVNRRVLEAVYAPMFEEMETHYLRAWRAARTEFQRQRLDLFADNLVQLHYALRHTGLLAHPARSAFHRTDEEFGVFMKAMEGRISLTREKGRIPHVTVWEGEFDARRHH